MLSVRIHKTIKSGFILYFQQGQKYDLTNLVFKWSYQQHQLKLSSVRYSFLQRIDIHLK